MTIVNTDSVGAGVRIDLGAVDEAWTYITQGTLIASTTNDAIVGTGNFQRVSVAGEVIGSSFNAIDLDGAAAVIEILSTGILSAPAGGLSTSTINVAANAYIANHGMISGRTGIIMENGQVMNTGTISASIANTSTGDGILITGAGLSRIDNSGTISAFTNAIRSTAASGATVYVDNSGTIIGEVDLDSSGSHQVTNSGEILGVVSTASGNDTITNTGRISEGVSTSGGTDFVINSGVIEGTVNLGDGTDTYMGLGGIVEGDVVLGDGVNTFFNSGSIGDDVYGGVDADHLTNEGLIGDDVFLGLGDDVFRGFGGTVLGTIYGSDGNDTFYVDQVGIDVDGGADYDIVYARADFVSGGNIEEIILRGTNDISGTGDDGANLIRGRAGDNDIFGLGGNDNLFGGNGDDFLDGGGGKDVLRGDMGDDILFGSLGADILYGGGGADTFLFTTAAESGIGSDRDQIRDFSRGEDVIDISELSDPAFTFEGTGGLSGTGPSIAYFVNANGHAIVDIDVDGDGVRDMQIAVFDNAVLTADDFLL